MFQQKQPPQNFTFSTDIWDIIISNLDGLSMRSLCSTCKYFYKKQQEIKENRLNYNFLNSKYNIVTIDGLEIISSGGLGGSETVITAGYMESLKLCIDKNVPIKKLVIQDIFKSTARKCILSSFIFSKILYCNLTELSIEYNKITWNEYLLLTAAGRILKLSLEGVDITDSKKNQVPVDMIMVRVPYADEIHIQPCYFSPKTNLNLLLLNRRKRTFTLNFVNIYGDFDSKSFYSFLKKNLISTSNIMIHFAYNAINNNLNENFIEELKSLSKKEKWTTAFHMDYPRNFDMIAKTLNMDILLSFINSTHIGNSLL